MARPKTKRITNSATEAATRRSAPRGCCAVGGDFYNGVEWLACWLLDNREGEEITEEQLRGWAIEAWKAHLKRHNAKVERP